MDIVNGYDAGADDYITKPFSLMVLISKVNAIMRRTDYAQQEGNELVSGEIQVLCREMKVYKEGIEVIHLWRKPIGLPMGWKPLFSNLTLT